MYRLFLRLKKRIKKCIKEICYWSKKCQFPIGKNVLYCFASLFVANDVLAPCDDEMLTINEVTFLIFAEVGFRRKRKNGLWNPGLN
jgi:hypothetical protein